MIRFSLHFILLLAVGCGGDPSGPEEPGDIGGSSGAGGDAGTGGSSGQGGTAGVSTGGSSASFAGQGGKGGQTGTAGAGGSVAGTGGSSGAGGSSGTGGSSGKGGGAGAPACPGACRAYNFPFSIPSTLEGTIERARSACPVGSTFDAASTSPGALYCSPACDLYKPTHATTGQYICTKLPTEPSGSCSVSLRCNAANWCLELQRPCS